jgi:hypothetical protein
MDKTITTEEKERGRIVAEKEPNDIVETGGRKMLYIYICIERKKERKKIR